jgi:hypothetical protein
MSQSPVIMIVRHAEKAVPEEDGVDPTGQADKHSLTVSGWQRAGAMVPLFAPLTRPMPEPRLVRPEHLIAEFLDAPGSEQKKSRREEQTLAPLAAMLNTEPDFSFGKGQEAEAAAKAKRCYGPVLIAWEHKKIFELARHLIVDVIPEVWPSDRYDLVLVLRLQNDGRTYSFEQVPQLLLAGDSPSIIS